MTKRETSQRIATAVKCSSAKGPPGDPTPVAVAPEAKGVSASNLTDETLKNIGEESAWLARAAESVFCKLADGGQLSDDELTVLRRVGPRVVPRDNGRSARAFERWKNSEANRIHTVRKLQGTAGSSAERQAASDAAEQAEAKLSKRSAEIDAELRRLEAEAAAPRSGTPSHLLERLAKRKGSAAVGVEV